MLSDEFIDRAARNFALTPGMRMQRFARAIEAEVQANEPDRFCISQEDGSCVSTDPRCMHNQASEPIGKPYELVRVDNGAWGSDFGKEVERSYTTPQQPAPCAKCELYAAEMSAAREAGFYSAQDLFTSYTGLQAKCAELEKALNRAIKRTQLTFSLREMKLEAQLDAHKAVIKECERVLDAHEFPDILASIKALGFAISR